MFSARILENGPRETNQPSMSSTTILELPAIAIQQSGKHKLFTFAIDGKQLHTIARVSRLGRGDNEKIIGYQRPEVISHITQIRNDLESADAMLPNAIVVAFEPSVEFRPLEANDRGTTRHGHLVVPLKADGNCPGWIVDGQQRAAAIRDASVEQFPVFVTAFVTDNVEEQREQFILVNSTKPLPKGLIYELLPSTDMALSTNLQKKRFPAYLLERLNFDSRSPLLRSIQTPTTPQGFIKDNSILKMLENSLNDGALCRFISASRGEDQTDDILTLLFNFWNAVATVFPDAWKLPPTKSRLTHGAGIQTMGHLMDAICDRFRSQGIPTTAQFEADLRPLEPICSWSNGYWNFGPNMQRKWNEIQNTSGDIRLVASHLLVQYKRLVWSVSDPRN